jgi:aspartokinase
MAEGPSVTQAVRTEIGYDSSVRDALARDYVNISALALVLKPMVEARVGRKVDQVGIVSALKRVRDEFSPEPRRFGRVIADSIVNVRTHVSRLSVERSKRAMQTASSLLATFQEDFIQVSESLSSITLIFDQRLHRQVKKAFLGAEVLEEGEECAALTVHSPDEIITTPGCISAFFDQLSRRQVNVEDTVSCYTDTIMVVGMKDAGKAFEALTELVEEEKRRQGG